MGYAKIPNLYKDDSVLLFRECYALEKVHGTSAHVAYRGGALQFFAGGNKHETFVALFDQGALLSAFAEIGHDPIVVYGEGYGGKCMGMKETYGSEQRFIAFEVQVGDCWLAVPQAEDVVTRLGLEFVPYICTLTDSDALDHLRDAPSEVAERRGIHGKPREGIVLRPLIEVRKNNGERIIAKHKADAFAERVHVPRSLKQAEFLHEALAIAEEWVTPMRLVHVLDKLGGEVTIQRTGEVVKAMLDDVVIEANGEIADNKGTRKAIGRRAVCLFKEYLNKTT